MVGARYGKTLWRILGLCLLLVAMLLFEVPGLGAGAMLAAETSIAPLDAGTEHSLALGSDGTIWGWGYNYDGELGDGTTKYKNTPIQGLSGVRALAGGGGHSIALKADGTVWAWGDNDYGQVGNGTTSNKVLTPVRVQGLTDVVAISAGGGHCLALKSGGTVWAWGYNFEGQLGDGTKVNKSIPVQVQGLTGVRGISAGGGHSLALKSDGTVWAWGYNQDGQLGIGTGGSPSATPVQVQGISAVQAISAGRDHCLALKSDGSVWAWGLNAHGELGIGNTSSKSEPMLVNGMSEVQAISAGSWHSLAVKSDGAVWAWGCNSDSQLGDGTQIQRKMPVQVQELSGARSVAAGGGHSLAVKSDGTVWTWGDNLHGELGDGTNTDRSTPVQVHGAGNVGYLDDIMQPAESSLSLLAPDDTDDQSAQSSDFEFTTDPNNIVWNPTTHTAEYIEFNFVLPADINFTKGKYAVIRYSSTGGGNWKIISSAKLLTSSGNNQYYVGWDNVQFERGPQQLAIFDGNPTQDSSSQLKAMGWFPHIISDLTPALVPNNDQTMGNNLLITFSMNKDFVAKAFPNGIYALLRYAPNTNSKYIPARERSKVESLGSDRYCVIWNNATSKPGRMEVVVLDGKDSNPEKREIYAVRAIGFYEYPFQDDSSQDNPSQALAFKATTGDGYITLDWSAAANTAGLDGYYLYKGTSPGGEDASPMFDFPINALTYKDTQVTNGKTYYYILKPCYNQGTLLGSSSNEASATPQGNKGGTIVLTIGNPHMKVNGQNKEIDPGKGTAPTIVSGRTFLPIRAVIETMGGTVAWNETDREVTIVFNKKTINLWIGKTTATVNGTAKKLDVAPYISKNRPNHDSIKVCGGKPGMQRNLERT